MDIVLHIGMPKTGSTSIQNMLEANRDVFADHGVLYPVSPGRRNAQLGLPARIHAMTGEYEGIRPRVAKAMRETIGSDADAERFDCAFARELERSGARRCVISCEALWSFATVPHRVELLARYLQPFGRLRVIAYLRRQDRHVTSFHAHTKRFGEPQSLDELAREYRLSGFYDYERHLGTWRAACGPDGAIVRPYERSALVGGDATTDFVETLALPSITVEPGAYGSNPSLDRTGVAFMNTIGRTVTLQDDDGLPTPLAVALQRRLCGRPGDGPPRWAASKARAFLAHFEDGNARIARDYLGRADGTLFREPVEGPEEDDPETLDHDAFAKLSAAMFAEESERADAMTRKLRETREYAVRLRAERDAALAG